ncbi:MAG: response regulator transcription factor [Acidimicrobiia bacterium]|nr:response regulator transcription factor [Acidimicrobiia bacterium]
MPFSVLLVEDHQIVRDGIKAILERCEDFQVIGGVDTGTEAILFCRRTPPDLVVMDLSLPGLNGIETTAEVLRHCPSTHVVVLSAFDDDKHVLSAIRAGAHGFLVKKASLLDLIDALRTVARGGLYFSPEVSTKLVRRFQVGDLDDSAEPPQPLRQLSPRELQVLKLVAEGKSSKEIAVTLQLGLETIRSYRKTMMRKLGVNNVASLTQLAISTGLTGSHATEPKEL